MKTTYKLNYSASEGGHIAGLTDQEVEEGADGEIVIAVADKGYKLKKWSDGVTTEQRQDKNVKSDKNVTAEFVPLGYFVLTYNASEGGHIVGLTEQEVKERTDGEVVIAVADEGYKFKKWSDGVTTEQRKDKNVKSDKNVTAEFVPLEYFVLTYTASEGGYIEGDQEQTVLEKTNGTIVTAIAEYGYTFSAWSDGVTEVSRQEFNVNDNKTLTAYFEQMPPFTLAYTADSEYGYIQGETVQKVLAGKNGMTVTAISTKENWDFYCWSDGVETASRTDLNVTENIAVKALFQQVLFTYEYFFGDPEHWYGHIEGEAIQYVRRDESGTEVTAVPNEGCVFTGWTDGLKSPTRIDKVNKDLRVFPYFKKVITVTYRVNNGIGGRIEGETNQVFFQYNDSKPVKAVADDGYVFVGWSDGLTDTERYETRLTEDFTRTAYFEPIEKVFRYDYRGGRSNLGVQTVTVLRDNPKASTFTVPQKDGFDFVGWYADENYTVKVTDEKGNLMYGYNTVTLETDTLYARWLDPDDDSVIYKILIVVVDEIDAILPLREDSTTYKRLHHKISMRERLLSKQIAGKMSAYLNEWFAGKVKFEVDTYFTTQPVDTEAFGYTNHNLYPYRMKEVKMMCDNYDSFLVLFDMNDFDNEFIERGLSATSFYKIGCIHLETEMLTTNKLNKNQADELMRGSQTTEFIWDMFITLCLEVFVHTIEAQYYFQIYSLSETIWYFREMGTYNLYEIIRKYLLCEAEVNGETVGIPPDFWTNGA
ncbi:MAG: InlB B-repeat-containing protein [Clostridiales bacterium]|nr:InlB B-repeat-containing protein [Clostridiales bacterium]